MTPAQKASVVSMVREEKEEEEGKGKGCCCLLAIGDGSNDVPMLRAADVGVGVGVGVGAKHEEDDGDGDDPVTVLTQSGKKNRAKKVWRILNRLWQLFKIRRGKLGKVWERLI